MKGSMPLPYIVALILGIAVIAIILYMFFTQTGIFTLTIDQKFCDVKCVEYALTCDPIGWPKFIEKYPNCLTLKPTCTCETG